ncbi:MAG: MarR family transcriptional regulator [Lachnospiraceae bacterium]|nr:MarR family transcriptional regulator [Lachnospiraceae bacterium]
MDDHTRKLLHYLFVLYTIRIAEKKSFSTFSSFLPIVELSQKTGLAKNTLTSMLGRMEEAGLIARKSGKADRRQSLITLTEKARNLESKYREVSDLMNGIIIVSCVA